jgi:hypothetical protein
MAKPSILKSINVGSTIAILNYSMRLANGEILHCVPDAYQSLSEAHMARNTLINLKVYQDITISHFNLRTGQLDKVWPF